MTRAAVVKKSALRYALRRDWFRVPESRHLQQLFQKPAIEHAVPNGLNMIGTEVPQEGGLKTFRPAKS